MEKLQRRRDHCTQINSNTPQATQIRLSYTDRKAIIDSATLKLVFRISFGHHCQVHFNNFFPPNVFLVFCRAKDLIMKVRNLS